MNEMFIAEIGSYEEDQQVTKYTTRTWPYILTSLNWILSHTIPASINVQNGLALVVINETAAIIEGVISEIVLNNLKGSENENVYIKKKFDRLGFGTKKEQFNKTMNRKMETYPSFEAIEKLFLLRNHISHGKPHVELNMFDEKDSTISKVKSADSNYEKVRQFLIQKNVMKIKNRLSNVSDVTNIHSGLFFFSQSITFITSLIIQTEFQGKENVLLNLKMAMNNKYEI